MAHLIFNLVMLKIAENPRWRWYFLLYRLGIVFLSAAWMTGVLQRCLASNKDFFLAFLIQAGIVAVIVLAGYSMRSAYHAYLSRLSDSPGTKQ